MEKYLPKKLFRKEYKRSLANNYAFFLSAFILFCTMGYGQTFTTIAEDNANNYGTAWSGNGGSGFAPWTFRDIDDGGFAGEFLELNANSASPAISSNNKSFGSFANSGTFPRFTAYREFNQNLKPGDKFTVEIQHGGITAGGSMGFTLRSGNNTTTADNYNTDSRFELAFIGGQTNYSIFADNTTDTGIGFTSGGIRVEVTIVDTNTVDVAVTTLTNNNTTNFTNITLGGALDTEILSLALFNRNARDANVYFNSIVVEREIYTTVQNGDYSDITTWINNDLPLNGRGQINIDHEVNLDNDLEILNILNINNPSGSLVLQTNATISTGISGTINNTNSIIFKSDNSGSAQFGENKGTYTETGTVTVERYISAKRAFRFLASPVATTTSINENWQEGATTANYNPRSGFGTHISGTAGTVGNVNATTGHDETFTGNPSMFIFDNTIVGTQGGASGAWLPVTNTLSTNLDTETSYLLLVRGDRSMNLSVNSAPSTSTTLSATGSLFTGTSTLDTDSATASSPGKANAQELSDQEGYFSMVANPYQAVVDFNQVTKTNLTDNIYVWDASIGGTNGNGGYITYNLDTGINNILGNDVNQYIAPGMSFFVENLTTDPIEGIIFGLPEIIFEENDKATNQTQVTVFNDNSDFYINSALYSTSDYQNGNTVKDAVYIAFSPEYTTPGNSEDGGKIITPNEMLAVVNNGLRSLDLQNLPEIGHNIELYISNYTETNYTLFFDMGNQPDGLGVFLHDAYLNTQTEVTDNFTYDFTANAGIPGSIASDRFSLVFNNTTLGVNENSFGNNFSLYPNPSTDGQFSIKTPGLSGKADVEITNLLGQKVYSKQITAEGQQFNINTEGLSTGVYIVKLSQNSQTFNAKLILK